MNNRSLGKHLVLVFNECKMKWWIWVCIHVMSRVSSIVNNGMEAFDECLFTVCICPACWWIQQGSAYGMIKRLICLHYDGGGPCLFTSPLFHSGFVIIFGGENWVKSVSCGIITWCCCPLSSTLLIPSPTFYFSLLLNFLHCVSFASTLGFRLSLYDFLGRLPFMLIVIFLPL